MKKDTFHLPALLLITFLLLLVPFLAARDPGTGQYAEQIRIIERYVAANMELFKIPGLTIGFYKDDFTWTKGFGFADLENRVPAASGTLFRMASVTKPMTAMGVVKLAQEGKLNLDAEVQDYVPYFPKKKWPLTIRQLLGHLGGVSHYRDEDKELHLKTHRTTRQAIEIFKDWDLQAEPGTRFIYSSYGYNLLGAVIEGASGLSFDRYMTENIWQPLGMNNTRMDIADDIIPNRTRGYRIIDGEIKNCEPVDISSRFGSGGILSAVVDMLNFARGLDNGKVLSIEAQEVMYESMKTRDNRITEYGMGWRVDYLSGFWNVSHSGGQAGTSTFLLRFPGEHFAAAAAVNLQGQNIQKFVTIIQNVILDAFHIRVETPAQDEDEYRKLHFVWHVGLGYLSRYHRPYTEDVEELAKSFAYFNHIDARDDKVQQKIVEGLYETTGAPLFKVGTYMAHTLGNTVGPEKPENYRKMGAISFFAAYINLYKNDTSIPAKFHFTRKMEKRVARWHKSWKKTWTAETKAFFLLPLCDLSSVKEQVKKIFKDQSAYPLFNITGYARELLAAGELQKGIELLRLGLELYPKNPAMYYTFGEFYLNKFNNQKALEIFKKALPVDKDKKNAARYISWVRDLIRVAKKPVVLSAAALRKFSGDYGPRHIIFAGDSLHYMRDGRKKFRLIPLNNDTFALAGLPYFRIRFNIAQNGQISKITGMYINGITNESPRDPQVKK